MIKKSTFLLIAILAAASNAWAVNKCTMPDGKVVFQDAPCQNGRGETLQVRPASGSAKPVPEPAISSESAGEPTQQPLTRVQQIEKQIEASQKARRKQEYEVRLLPDALAAIHSHRVQCDKAMADLQYKKRYANNNLAGATWEESISTEMTAIATRCDTRNRELTQTADRLRTECRALEGCK